jgi:hypothetical protein
VEPTIADVTSSDKKETKENDVIQVDIGGHPPFPNGSKQFSGHFGNLLFLAGFHFRGHFEGLNEVFFEIEVLNDIQRHD